MSTQPEQLYDENGDPVEAPGAPPRSDAEWAALRREKRANKEKDEQIAALKRESAFRDAGIDLADDSPLVKMFVKGYDGEVTADAIKAAALAVGFTDNAVPAVDPVVDAAPDAAARIANAAAGGATEVPEGTAALDEAYRTGGIQAMLESARAQGITVTGQQQY